MKMRRLLRTSALSFAMRAISILLEFAIVLLLGRALGPAGLGIYAFYYALVRLISIPLTAGLPTLSVREIAQTHALGKFPLMRGFIRRSTQFIMIFSGLLLLLGSIWLWTRSEDAATYLIELFALLLIPLIALGNLRGAMMRGLSHVLSGQLPEYLLRPGVFAFFLLVAYLVAPDKLDASSAMLLHLVAAMLAFLAGMVLFFRILPGEVRSATPEFADRQWAKAIIPFSLIAGIQIVNSQAAISVLGFYGLDADAGLFRLAQQISLIAAFPITALALVITPMFARAHAMGERERLQELMQVSTAAIFVFAIIFFGAVLLAGEPLIRMFFGSAFAPSFPALVVLLVGQLFNCFTGALNPLLKMIGEERAFAWVAGIGAVINILLAVLLAVPFGVMGGAFATAASLTFVSLVLGLYSLRVLHINPFPTMQGASMLYKSIRGKMK